MAAELVVAPVSPAEWGGLAPFIAAFNIASSDVRCFHSHAGDDVAAHADELRSLGPEAACYCAARRGDRIVGVVGAEYDQQLGRAWLRGPLVAPGEDFASVGGALLDALNAQLPPTIMRHDAFVSADCAEALDFYRARRFAADAGHDEFTLAAPMAMRPWPRDVQIEPPDTAWRDAIAVLHEAEFPGAYVSAQALFAPPSPDRFTRIALVDGVPAGYVHAHYDAQWREGYVDFLAVVPTARQRGVGRALLQTAVDWSFGQHAARAVTLTVRADRAAARALYLAAGFVRVRTGIGMQRRTDG